MAAGPQEERLRQVVDPARTWQAFHAREQWARGAEALQEVAQSVQRARPLARKNLGNHTADAADKAFVAMHDKVLARQQQMKDGSDALNRAMEALGRAEAVVHGFDAEGPLTEPDPPDWDEDEVRQIQQQKSHQARMSVHADQVAAREEAAAAALRDMDATNQSSSETMRRIQGDRPDRPGATSGGAGAGAATPAPTPGGARGVVGGAPAHPVSTGHPAGQPTFQPAVPSATYPVAPSGSAPTDSPAVPTAGGETGTPQGSGGTTSSPAGGAAASPTAATPPSTTGAGTAGGLAGAVGGGLAGGAAGLGGAIRGGGAATPAPAAGARAIGSTARSGAGGALGRSAATGGTTPAARGGAAGAAGRGTGARGPGARGPGARGTGARGAGAGGAGGRGGRGNPDEKQGQRDALHDDQDWVDDEDAGPGVIS